LCATYALNQCVFAEQVDHSGNSQGIQVHRVNRLWTKHRPSSGGARNSQSFLDVTVRLFFGQRGSLASYRNRWRSCLNCAAQLFLSSGCPESTICSNLCVDVSKFVSNRISSEHRKRQILRFVDDQNRRFARLVTVHKPLVHFINCWLLMWSARDFKLGEHKVKSWLEFILELKINADFVPCVFNKFKRRLTSVVLPVPTSPVRVSIPFGSGCRTSDRQASSISFVTNTVTGSDLR